MTKVVWSFTARLVIAATAIAGVSCGELTRQGQSPAYLIVEAVEGAPGFEPDEFGGFLQADVFTVIEGVGGVYNDVGRVRFRLGLKDPGAPTAPNVPTSANRITIDRYRIVYIRADGRNTPGVDVPYGFDGAMTVTVPAEGTAQGVFQLVRHTAKQEAPLAALQFNGVIIDTIAEITFYGHDQTGRAVSATGRIGVAFGNFADPID